MVEVNSEGQVEKYLVNRIRSADYRGIHLSQHNRITEEKLAAILEAIDEVAGDSAFAVPPGDPPAGAELSGGYTTYSEIVSNINDRGQSVTLMSLKKNLFPDLFTVILSHQTPTFLRLANQAYPF
jgi:hypothetical protein